MSKSNDSVSIFTRNGSLQISFLHINSTCWKTTEKRHNQKIEINDAGQLFPGHITTVKINGNTAAGIELFKLPLLYVLQDNLEKGQILRVPTKILKIPGRVDEELITIRAYLLRRVDAMKHSSRLSRMIIFKNILEEVGVDPTDRGERNKPAQVLKRTERILDYWKEEGYIKGYRKLNRKGETTKGQRGLHEIEIIL